MLATETAYICMKLTGETTATETSYKIRITEDDTYSNQFENGVDAELLSLSPSNSHSVFLYAFVGNKMCSSVYDSLVTNRHIGFQTNRVDNKYSITFTTVEGRNLKFYDAALDSTFLITSNNQVYNFEVNTTNCPSYVAGTNTPINDRFILEPVFEFKVCTTFDHVEIYENQGSDNIVITNAAGETVVDVAPVPVFQTIDLSGKPAGHYFLTVNGTQYEFCNKPQPKE